MSAAMKDLTAPGAVGGSGPGFSANITGASLADLVQMECLANATRVVRVVSNTDAGYLYFRAGQIVHAMTSSALGEAAAQEILAWDRGTFEPCNAGWPNAASIGKSWQALLMQAATSRDEARRRTVVDFPRERSQASPMHKPPVPLTSAPLPPSGSPASSSAPQSGTTLGGAGIERAVRLEPDGKIVSSRGEVEELAAITAYALRLATLVGESLGLDDLRAVEAVTTGERRLFYLEKNGNLIGLEAPTDADVSVLRERLGF
jgi:hypothetical protein